MTRHSRLQFFVDLWDHWLNSRSQTLLDARGLLLDALLHSDECSCQDAQGKPLPCDRTCWQYRARRYLDYSLDDLAALHRQIKKVPPPEG